jgi:hypothetical protein
LCGVSGRSRAILERVANENKYQYPCFEVLQNCGSLILLSSLWSSSSSSSSSSSLCRCGRCDRCCGRCCGGGVGGGGGGGRRRRRRRVADVDVVGVVVVAI